MWELPGSSIARAQHFDERRDHHTMTDRKDQQTNSLEIVMMATYFFIPFYGLRIALEKYLMQDDPGMGYMILLGVVSGIIETIYLAVLKPKSTKVKIIGIGILLVLVTIINLIVD